MSSEFEFDPERVIRRKKFIVSNGKAIVEIIGVFYENDDGRFIVSFLKDMEILREIDVTDEWLRSKSIHQVDVFMNDFVSHTYTVNNNPW